MLADCDEWVTVRKAAEELGISGPHLHRVLSKKPCPLEWDIFETGEVARERRIKRSSLERFKEARLAKQKRLAERPGRRGVLQAI